MSLKPLVGKEKGDLVDRPMFLERGYCRLAATFASMIPRNCESEGPL